MRACGTCDEDIAVARTLAALLVRSTVHALRDVGRLAVQEHLDLCRLPVEAVLLVTDVADRLARRRLELRRIDDRFAVGTLEYLS